MNIERLMRIGRIHAFGDSGGGSSAGTQDVTTKAQPPDFQLPALQQLMSKAQGYLAGPAPSYYPGSTQVDFQPEQIGGQNQVLDYATGQLPDLASTAIASNQFSLGAAMDPASNPYLQATAQNMALPIVRGYEQITRPGIAQEAVYAGEGGYGSSRHGIAEGLAGQAAIDSIARNTYGLFTDAYNTGQENAIRAQAIAPTLLQTGTLPGTLTSGVGDVRQAMDQAMVDDDIARFYFEQNAPLTQLQQYQNLIGGNYGGTTQSQGTATQPKGSTFGNILGGAATGASLGSIIPGVGTGFGAAAGAVLGLLGLV